MPARRSRNHAAPDSPEAIDGAQELLGTPRTHVAVARLDSSHNQLEPAPVRAASDPEDGHVNSGDLPGSVAQPELTDGRSLDMLDVFLREWRSNRVAREQQALDSPTSMHNALFILWTAGADADRESLPHIVTGRVPSGDPPSFVVPDRLQQRGSDELVRWDAWCAQYRPEIVDTQHGVVHFVALYVRGVVLCWDASPDFPLLERTPDVRALITPPHRWHELLPLPDIAPNTVRPGGRNKADADPETGEWLRPADRDSFAIGSSTLLPHTFRAMRTPDRWVRPGDGNPPYYEERPDDVEEADRVRVILHPSDGRSPLTPEQEAAAYQTVLSLDDNKIRAFAIALGSWFAGTSGGDANLRKVTLTANALLEFQGVKRNKGAYRPAQKEKVANDVWALNSIFIRGPQIVYDNRGHKKVVKVKSRLLEVAQEDETNLLGEEVPYAFRIAPGEWIKPLIEQGTRYVALLLSPVLRYNPRQGVELYAMRIGLHLALHWRFRAAQGNFAQPWNIRTLLESTAIDIPTHREQRRRMIEHFEGGLDRLREDGVLASWEYVRLAPEEEPTAVFGKWIKHTVRIVPPLAVTEQYASISRKHRLEVAVTKRRDARPHLQSGIDPQ